jgi:O-antigen ligase
MFIGFLIQSIIAQKKYIIGSIGLGIIIISIFSILHFVPEVSDRIKRMIDVVENGTPDASAMESTGVRMLVWSASNDVIAENLILGTGTGDSKDELMKVYKERGMTGAYEHNLNSHNEFYQVFVALGIIGFILLFANLWFPLFSAIKSGNTIYVLFLLIIIFNFLTESMFETQAGVMFYGFFNSLLCFQKSK